MAHIHPDAQKLVAKLGLYPHPEGGFFRESYRATTPVEVPGLAGQQDWIAGTGIYFLLTRSNFSAFHRIRFDELWHYYAGDPVEIIEIAPSGNLQITILGSPLTPGCVCQHMVPGGTWFAFRIAGAGAWALAGCTVAPGFEFGDFELADREMLQTLYPEQTSIIHALTREE